MNITIISKDDFSGGAAIAANRLHKAFHSKGYKSYMLVKNKSVNDEFVIKCTYKDKDFVNEAKKFKKIHKFRIKKNRTSLSNTIFSFPYPGFDLSKTEIINKSDILNLHFIKDFQSVESIAKLLSLDIPVVWTLHDQNPFTGGCHYSAECKKYMDNCYDCPQLENNQFQIPYYVLKNKIKNWKSNLTLVTPSKWMKNCVKRSTVFSKYRVEHIPNSIDNSVFKPLDKVQIRKRMGIAPEKKIILFGSDILSAKRKGFLNLLNALSYCFNNKEFNKMVSEGKLELITFGSNAPNFEKLNVPILSLGKIDSDKELVELYNIADFFILPSLEDNLPNTMLESLACGTPIVAFNTGGIPEVVINNKTGYTIEAGNDAELGKAILKMLFQNKQRVEMGQNGIDLINRKYRPEIQTDSYYKLFNSLIDKKKKIHLKKKFKKEIEICFKKSDIDDDFFCNLSKCFFEV